jgi:putative ABC transport system permease protein
MRLPDLLRFATQSLRRQRFRSAMLLLAVAIGVAAVLVLTALGEGARRYVLGEFAFLGKDTLVMLPGRKETTGGMPPIMGTAPRDITLREVEILGRTVPGIERIAPLVVGNAPASHESLSRDAIVLGTTRDFFTVRRLTVSRGELLPAMPATEERAVAVIGETIRDELFGRERAIGQWIRLRDYRFRVVGVLSVEGDSFGMNMREAIVVPVASAQALFNVEGLFRVVLRISDRYRVDTMRTALERRMTDLHEGELDVTVVSPDAMISTLSEILQILTLGVGGIAAISLLVAGIMVMNVMLVTVRQRTAEIGLLKALGAPNGLIRTLILVEAALLAALGVLLGLAIGQLAVIAGRALFPTLPFATPAWASVAASGLAILVALFFAWLPAQQAARLEPVAALGKS